MLVVTLVNSAVENFNQRVNAFIEAAGLLPHLGYRVRTLHGLAHDIVRERPGLVGLADNFQIVDEREADSIRQDAARAWLQSHPYDLDDYLDPTLDEGRRDWLRREQLPELVGGVALSLIRTAKDMQLDPRAPAPPTGSSCRCLCRWRRWAARSMKITSAPWSTAARWISMT